MPETEQVIAYNPGVPDGLVLETMNLPSFHATVDRLDADTRPYAYAAAVWASRAQREQAIVRSVR
jgi:hypothetical protein